MGAETLRERLYTWWQGLVREQKISVIILFLFTIVTLLLSTVHLRSQIVAPFMVSKTVLVKADAVFASQREEEKRQADLRIKDTDRDGLTDYAELYIYRTSPYLSDTDSDNIPDSVEIAQGTNPLCPEGKNCMGGETGVVHGSASSSLTDLLATNQIPRAVSEATTVEAMGTGGIQAFVDSPIPPDQMTPLQIRTYLVSHGLVTQSQIEGLSDDMVKQVYAAAYQEALRIQSAQAATLNASSSSTSSTTN